MGTMGIAEDLPESLAIRVRNVSKNYRIGIISRKTFRDELVYRWMRLTGRDPKETLGKIGGTEMSDHGLFHALDDVSFDIRKGETVGLIGRNGAGKSTMLKILARITTPTTGEAWIRGRVGSMLEVGTGFHPELTGRENIYLNGSILGMSKAEIDAKFDEIVEFSEIGDFLDTPVKRYSSGMYVKLAFSIASSLDTDILLLDEVLAVGDAAFRKKSLARMREVAKSGRTIIFVSHSTGDIREICSRCIWFKEGVIFKDGPAAKIVDAYLADTLPPSLLGEALQEANDSIGGSGRESKVNGNLKMDKDKTEENLKRQISKLEKRVADLKSATDKFLTNVNATLNELKPMRNLLSIPSIDKEKMTLEMELAALSPGTALKGGGRIASEVVVTLTSVPERMYDVHYAVHSLLSQSVKPNRVILWLGEEKFPNRLKDVPSAIRNLESRGLEIRFCHDVGPYTRLISALQAFPEAILVSAADDMFYPSEWLKTLLKEHLEHPEDVIGLRANLVSRSETGQLAPRATWTQIPLEECLASPDIVLTTMSGVLYPPKVFSPEVSDESLFSSLTPLWPDLWLWAMSKRNGRISRKACLHEGQLLYVNPEREAGLRAESTLRAANKASNGYDTQLSQLLSVFPDL